MNDAPYHSSFALWGKGMRISHTVRSEGSAAEHCAAVHELIGQLEQLGHTVTEAGLEPNQEKHDVSGYVVSVTRKGDKVLHCYTDYFEHPMRGGSIYEDHWDKLPFEPVVETIYDGVGKLPKDMAEQKGYLIKHRFQAVIARTGKTTELGHPEWRFSHALPAGGQPANPPTTATPTSGGDTTSPSDLCKTITEYIASPKVANCQDLVTASIKALRRKSDLENCWGEVQKMIRARLISFVNLAENDTQLEELEAAVRSITKVLPDGYANTLCNEIAAKKSSDIAF